MLLCFLSFRVPSCSHVLIGQEGGKASRVVYTHVWAVDASVMGVNNGMLLDLLKNFTSGNCSTDLH